MLLEITHPQHVPELISIVVPSVLAAILAFVKWYLPWRRKVRSKGIERKSIKQLRSIQKIYSIMGEQIDETSAERVIVFAGHDSGEIPAVGSPYYISSIYWKVKHDPKFHPGEDVEELDENIYGVIKDYREISADLHYINMLLDIQDEGVVRIHTKDLPEDCIMKTYYTLEGVTDAVIIYLGYSKNNLNYMSVSTFKKAGFTDDDVARIKLKASIMKQEFGFDKKSS